MHDQLTLQCKDPEFGLGREVFPVHWEEMSNSRKLDGFGNDLGSLIFG